MDLTVLAGSRVPNAFALLCAAVLVVAAFKLRSGFRWGFAFLAAAFLAAVFAKNVSYGDIITDFNTDTSPAVQPDYADALGWVVVAQVAIATCVLIAGLASRGLRWLSVATALAMSYAALCMFGWRQVYLTSAVDGPVQYEMWAPVLHAIVLGLLIGAIALATVSFARRRKAPRRSRETRPS